ncbi:hypothetical protein HK098_007391 [Nowakowskiella sp. JEL0407]|nr:hypothetical protein HK098_007391 [Nowakowskiella sp. JEL0407]
MLLAVELIDAAVPKHRDRVISYFKNHSDSLTNYMIQLLKHAFIGRRTPKNEKPQKKITKNTKSTPEGELPPVAVNKDSSNPLLNLKPDGRVDTTRGADGKRNNGSFCNGKVIRNGTQNKKGSCSPTVQGDIPSFDNMVSTLIISPKNGAKIKLGEKFTIAVDVDHMQLGTFDDPQSEYYITPQSLNEKGDIIGHIHVVAQKMGNGNNGNRALDARKFDFFKGLQEKGTENGRQLSVDVVSADGKPGLQEEGEFRICSITGQRNHAPVIMPVAKRGSQDDCIRITVVKDLGKQGDGNGDNEGNGQEGNNGKEGNGEGNQGDGKKENGGGNQGDGKEGNGGNQGEGKDGNQGDGKKEENGGNNQGEGNQGDGKEGNGGNQGEGKDSNGGNQGDGKDRNQGDGKKEENGGNNQGDGKDGNAGTNQGDGKDGNQGDGKKEENGGGNQGDGKDGNGANGEGSQGNGDNNQGENNGGEGKRLLRRASASKAGHGGGSGNEANSGGSGSSKGNDESNSDGESEENHGKSSSKGDSEGQGHDSFGSSDGEGESEANKNNNGYGNQAEGENEGEGNNNNNGYGNQAEGESESQGNNNGYGNEGDSEGSEERKRLRRADQGSVGEPENVFPEIGEGESQE